MGGVYAALVKWILVILAPVVLWFFIMIFWEIYYTAKGMQHKKAGKRRKFGSSIFKQIFWEFPRQVVLDGFNRDPEEFMDYGVHLIAGEQGSGKTVTMVYLLLKYQCEWPKSKISTNFNYLLEDSAIGHWKDILKLQNGIYGHVVVIDEMQNWFASMQSKNFPPEMLTEVTQQRKQHKVIYDTSQVFTRVGKPLREQTFYLYEPHTFLGCFTVVLKYRPVIDDDGKVLEKKFRGLFSFVQTPEIREAFDTFKKIELLAKEGFLPRSEQLGGSAGTQD